jgi:hypothetical protein
MEDTVEHASAYVIYNQCGYPIELEPDFSKSAKQQSQYVIKYKIPSEKTVSYQVETDIDEMFVRDVFSLRDRKKIQFKLEHPQYNCKKIKNVFLDSSVIRRVFVNSEGGEIRNLPLIIQCVPKDTRKCLLISSELQITNKTDKMLEVGFYF